MSEQPTWEKIVGALCVRYRDRYRDQAEAVDWAARQYLASLDGPMSDADEELRDKIENAINSCSAENGSDTPDFILAGYLIDCLSAFDKATCARERWHGRKVPVPVGNDEDAP